MEKKNVKKGMSAGAVVGIGATVAALGAAAYIMFGPDAKKNKKAIKGWAVKMKGEIIEKLEQAKEITEPVYHKIIDEVSAKYAKAKNINAKDVELAVAEVKKHWKTMVKDAAPKKKAKAKAKK
ncbi:MAG: hypothetical protein NTV03_03355 [Candidatus Nomurabacteria bacterium]|nr:hypothetical protein [Candidatus Nomurabacteria bacterium]